ncbi:Ubiquitin-like domain-containing CTD phosphatase 1 [Balamuthia mandrillaris]
MEEKKKERDEVEGGQLSHLSIILDIDGTLIDSFPHSLSSRFPSLTPTYVCPEAKENVFLRPHAKEFVEFCFQHFGNVAIWTAASEEWAEMVVKLLGLLPDRFSFIFTGKRCCTVTRASLECLEPIRFTVKSLKKVWQSTQRRSRGWQKDLTLILDDTPSTASHNYGNLIPVPTFNILQHNEDDLLLRLMDYLLYRNDCFQRTCNVRSFDKRGWFSSTPAPVLLEEEEQQEPAKQSN